MINVVKCCNWLAKYISLLVEPLQLRRHIGYSIWRRTEEVLLLQPPPPPPHTHTHTQAKELRKSPGGIGLRLLDTSGPVYKSKLQYCSNTVTDLVFIVHPSRSRVVWFGVMLICCTVELTAVARRSIFSVVVH